MPIYEFVCSKCGEEFEDLVPMSDPSSECPSCGSKKVRRQMPSSVGITFKGSGFYVTDNNKHTHSRKDPAMKPVEQSQAEVAKADEKKADAGDAKAEKKPARKTSSKTAAA